MENMEEIDEELASISIDMSQEEVKNNLNTLRDTVKDCMHKHRLASIKDLNQFNENNPTLRCSAVNCRANEGKLTSKSKQLSKTHNRTQYYCVGCSINNLQSKSREDLTGKGQLVMFCNQGLHKCYAEHIHLMCLDYIETCINDIR